MATLTREQIKEAVVKIIAEQLELDPHTFDEDIPLQGDLGADSLDLINIVIALENKFSFTIEEEFIQNFSTLRNVVDTLVKMMAGAIQKATAHEDRTRPQIYESSDMQIL